MAIASMKTASSLVPETNNTAYDGLGRLTAFRRGVLSASSNNGGVLDTITTASTTNSWSLDALGNPTTTGGATQTFNAQDQITSITGKTSPVYDNNGNMKTDESGNAYTFDAWNRMIEAQVGSTPEFYSYDADNRRPGLSICSGAVSDRYYSTAWQDIEDDVVPCAGTTTKSTYVWSESYIDDLVSRDQSTNGGAITRIYAEQDANHDATSLVSSSGTVLERFVYDPYGNRTVLTPSTWAVTSDSQSWVYGFQGGRLDPLTNKINFRNRDLDTGTDTWMEKDPTGAAYMDGADLYQVMRSSPITDSDASGEKAIVLEAGEEDQPTKKPDRADDVLTPWGRSYRNIIDSNIADLKKYVTPRKFDEIEAAGGVTWDGTAFSGNLDKFIARMTREKGSAWTYYASGTGDGFKALVKSSSGGITEPWDQLVIAVHGEYVDDKPTGEVFINGQLINQQKYLGELAMVASNALIVSCGNNSQGLEESLKPRSPFGLKLIIDNAAKACVIRFTPMKFTKAVVQATQPTTQPATQPRR